MENKKQGILQSSFLFGGLDTIQAQKLAQAAIIRSYKPKQMIIEESTVNNMVFIVIEGLVKIYKITPEGKENYLAIEKPGDYLGIMDLGDNPATATVEVLEPTTVLCFPKSQLIALLEKNPLLWEKMYKILLAKLKMNITLLTISRNNSLHEKTYLTLDFLSRLSKDNVIHLSHESLAQIIGATRPRVTEVLQTLKNGGKITLSSKKITLLQ